MELSEKYHQSIKAVVERALQLCVKVTLSPRGVTALSVEFNGSSRCPTPTLNSAVGGGVVRTSIQLQSPFTPSALPAALLIYLLYRVSVCACVHAYVCVRACLHAWVYARQSVCVRSLPNYFLS